VSHSGEWIANCLPERVERISAASVYRLKVGPPRPNQLQTMDDLEEKGLVGLYRLEAKNPEAIRSDQAQYLRASPFAPAPGALRSYMDAGENSGEGQA
jgi:hypothetical protein